MRNWHVLAVLMAAVLVAPMYGQSNTELSKQFQELKSEFQKLKAENAELRLSVTEQNDAELEGHISALAERYAAMNAGAVTTGADKAHMGGEFRFRNTWGIGDDASGGEHDGSWTDALMRINFAYNFSEKVTGFTEIQAHWTYGLGSSSTSVASGTSTGIYLYQAWLQVDEVFGRKELSSRTGRQEFVKGTEFQFGDSDWFNGISLDGTRWDWKQDEFELTAFAFQLTSSDFDVNQAPSFFDSHDNDEMYGLYLTFMPFDKSDVEIDLYWIYVNGHGNSAGKSSGGALGNAVGSGSISVGAGSVPFTSYYHTLGLRVGGSLEEVAAGLDFNLEFAYQIGTANVVGLGEADIEAFALEAEVGITFDEKSKVRAFIRFLYAEGPDDDSVGYIPLYTERRSNTRGPRYGAYDLIPMSNVMALAGGAHFSPADQWTVGIGAVWATTDEDIDTGAVNGSGDPITADDYGWELHIWVQYAYNDSLIFNAGFAYFDADDASQYLFGGLDDDSQLLFWLQARLLFGNDHN